MPTGHTFETEAAADDETLLLLFDDAGFAGQIDYCIGDPFEEDPAAQHTLYVWRIHIEPTRRRQGLTRVLLDELHRRHPTAQYLTLDLGTYAAHAVVQSWLGMAAESAHQARYPLPATTTPSHHHHR